MSGGLGAPADRPRPEEAADAELELVGRIRAASNATFLARIGDVDVVYKPVAGERPLWDFPDGTLAQREVAAYAVSEALGWHVVPRTWMRDGPLGPGMVQLWQEPATADGAVRLVPMRWSDLAEPDEGVVDAGWCHVLDGLDGDEQPVSLQHEDSEAMRRMAVFDVVTNNADRKGGHVLPMSDGHRYGVDHGLTFHAEHKLRTILWGWAGEPLTTAELAGVERLLAAAEGDLGRRLTGLLTREEVVAFRRRCERLLRRARFPSPAGDHPAIPWPPL